MVMTPQKQKSPAKVGKANGKGKPALATSKREDSARRLGSIPRRNLARENHSGIRRGPHDLYAGRRCGFRVVSPKRQGETRGDLPTRQGSDRRRVGSPVSSSAKDASPAGRCAWPRRPR